MGTILSTTPQVRPNATWSDYKHHNILEFLICIFPNSAITLSKVYISRASDKAIILKSCFLDVLPKHNNAMVKGYKG